MNKQRGQQGLFVAVCLITGVLIFLACSSQQLPDAEFDWKWDWAVPRDFSLQIDTVGYDFPSSIAFVPHPGDDPKDPLYFVTELRAILRT